MELYFVAYNIYATFIITVNIFIYSYISIIYLLPLLILHMLLIIIYIMGNTTVAISFHILFTGAALYALSSELLISNKF